jgi:hypothetical protein
VAWSWTVLLRLAYLGVTNAFALLRLLPVSSKDKDAEILALATSSLSCSGSSVRAGCGSPRVTGRSRVDYESHAVALTATRWVRSASITSIIRHYVARRAQVTEGHPHNAE